MRSKTDIKAMKPEGYDEIYSRDRDKYKKHYSESLYYPIWKKVLSMLSSSKSMIDIGCGTGQFAKMIEENTDINYTGLDFSAEAIRRARKLCPQFAFILGDYADYKHIHRHGAVVALEFMEHIENDLEFINQLAHDQLLIFSVPNFEAPNHLRSFASIKEIYDRYHPYIKFRQELEFDMHHRENIIFLCYGFKR